MPSFTTATRSGSCSQTDCRNEFLGRVELLFVLVVVAQVCSQLSSLLPWSGIVLMTVKSCISQDKGSLGRGHGGGQTFCYVVCHNFIVMVLSNYVFSKVEKMISSVVFEDDIFITNFRLASSTHPEGSC